LDHDHLAADAGSCAGVHAPGQMTPYPGGADWKTFSILRSRFGLSIEKGLLIKLTFGWGEKVSTRV
jgi:hypothetical protein